MECVNCHTELPANARFCLQCGTAQQEPRAGSEEELLLIDLKGNVSRQLTDAFFKRLSQKIAEEQPGAEESAYRELIYESGFRDLLHRREARLGDELRYLADHNEPPARQNAKVRQQLDELTDYFMIHYARSLNTIALPEAILRHQGPGAEDLPMESLIFDYLDFSSEPDEKVYTDFVKMPVQQLRNAGKFFLAPERRDERIFFICDQSLLGSCKEGFAMTERGLYWKAQLQTPNFVLYENLERVAREKEWLLIDGAFFNVNLRFNIKMLKLLRKLRERVGRG